MRCGADLLSMQGAELLAFFVATMFLRAKIRKKDGKLHRYFSVVENRRVGVKRRTVQRTVLRLGEYRAFWAAFGFAGTSRLAKRPQRKRQHWT